MGIVPQIAYASVILLGYIWHFRAIIAVWLGRSGIVPGKATRQLKTEQESQADVGRRKSERNDELQLCCNFSFQVKLLLREQLSANCKVECSNAA